MWLVKPSLPGQCRKAVGISPRLAKLTYHLKAKGKDVDKCIVWVFAAIFKWPVSSFLLKLWRLED